MPTGPPETPALEMRDGFEPANKTPAEESNTKDGAPFEYTLTRCTGPLQIESYNTAALDDALSQLDSLRLMTNCELLIVR